MSYVLGYLYTIKVVMTFCCNLLYPFYPFFFQIFTNMGLMQFVISLYSMPFCTIFCYNACTILCYDSWQFSYLFIFIIFVIIYQIVFTLLWCMAGFTPLHQCPNIYTFSFLLLYFKKITSYFFLFRLCFSFY